MRQQLSKYRSPWLWMPIALAAFMILPGLIMPFVTIDLQSVTVTSAENAMQARVTARRVTHFGFTGRFTVSFRHASDDLLVATPMPSDPFPYSGGLSGEIDRPLWWWAGGIPALQRHIDEGLHDDTFYAVTCHEWLIAANFVFARRCVRSNDFTLGEAQ